MKVAIKTGLLAKRDMYVNSGHRLGFRFLVLGFRFLVSGFSVQFQVSGFRFQNHVIN
jgi:hypothetical protein